MWIEVFKTGTHTDSAGNEKAYSLEDLNKMADMYNNQTDHIAPVVLGHPKTDDPAYGWGKKFKVVGEKLLAYVDQLSSDLIAAVKKGAYKKVSLAIYPNGLIRHIGFLGAVPPAVKGLAPLNFASDEEFAEYDSEYAGWATDEWRMPTVGRIFSDIREFIIEKFGRDVADKTIDKKTINTLLSNP